MYLIENPHILINMGISYHLALCLGEGLLRSCSLRVFIDLLHKALEYVSGTHFSE